MPVVRSNGGKRWMFETGRVLMEASCHHQSEGACGGCYARALVRISEIAEDGRNAKALAMLEELKAEKQARRVAR